jgi:radical SAM protein with 4Fe4S-binding SPASM domain
MQELFVESIELPKFALWEKFGHKGKIFSFDLEVTARCNNNCRHCYINLPADDKTAKEKELSFCEIKKIIDQAVGLGPLWCLITGGEPLLRKDFADIYVYIKKKGFLVSVFTNATLINKEHIKLFKRYPPRDIEVTVYGVTKDTYEKVTRVPGSFKKFMRGLDLLLKDGVNVRLKAMALRSNVDELPKISAFCRKLTKDYFRFDPLLHLRFDADAEKNKQIRSERLFPEEIALIEKNDSERFQALERNCEKLIKPGFIHSDSNRLFLCGAGKDGFAVSYDGFFCLCSSLRNPDCIYDLKKGSLNEAWQDFAVRIQAMRSGNRRFIKRCGSCELTGLCMWCPAHACLETGELDKPVDYFCKVAHARAKALGWKKAA